MVQPSIEALRCAGTDLYVLSSPAVAELLGDSIETGRALNLPPRKSPLSTYRLAAQLRSLKFDAALVVNQSLRSALTCKLAGIYRRIGHSREGRAPLLTDPVPYDPNEFQAASVARLTCRLGIEVMDVRPRLLPSFAERARATPRLGGATFGMHPGARDAWKRLPAEKLVFVARELIGCGETVAMFGGCEESALAEEIGAKVGRGIVNLVGSTTIRETGACLANLRATFGGDTGIVHISAAGGCPTIQVFGSQRALKWGHNYYPHRVVRAPEDDLSKIDERALLQAILDSARSS